MTARMKFQASVQGVKVSVAKGPYDNGAAYADITFRVQAPRKPSPPTRHSWQADDAQRTIDKLTKDGRELTAEETSALAEARKLLASVEENLAYQRESYAEQMRNLTPNLLAYAQVTGLVTLFGGQEVTLILEPRAQDMLPGLDIAMLPAPDDGEAGVFE